MKTSVLFLILCALPFNPFVITAHAQDIQDEFVDITLDFGDERYTALRDPSMLPASFPTSLTRSYYSETFGNVFLNGNAIYSESGDVVEVAGLSSYELQDLSKTFALFTNWSIYSFEFNDFFELTEPVDGAYIANDSVYCPNTKWNFSETCFQQRNNNVVRIESDRYLFVFGDSYLEEDAVYDLKLNTTVLLGSIEPSNVISLPSYTLVETIDERSGETTVHFLYPNGDLDTLVTTTEGQTFFLNELCSSDDYLRIGYYDSLQDTSGYRLINLQNGSFIEYPRNSFNEQCLFDTGYVMVNNGSTSTIPYSLDELYDLRQNNKMNELAQFRNQISCYYNPWGYLDNHYPNQFIHESSTRFMTCDVVNNTDSNYYFDTNTGDLIKTHRNFAPQYSNDDTVLFRSGGGDCLYWDQASNTLIPIIEIADFSCTGAFVHENRLFLYGGVAVVKYSSDGRIDLDDGVSTGDVPIDEKLSSGIENIFESNIFPIFLSVLFLLVLMKFKKDSSKNLEKLRQEILQEYELFEEKRIETYRDHTIPTNSAADAELIRAMNLFPEWSREQIQNHFDNGWSVDQLVEWKQNES